MCDRGQIHQLYQYKGHTGSKIISITYNPHNETFVSIDDKIMRMWDTSKEIRHVRYPKAKINYLQVIRYIPEKRVYFASALDRTIQIYDTQLTLLSCTFTNCDLILTIVYEPKFDYLITGGMDGCCIWNIKSHDTDSYEAQWNRCQLHELQLLKHFQKEGVPSLLENMLPSKLKSTSLQPFKTDEADFGISKWIQRIYIDSEQNHIYAAWKNHIDIYDLHTLKEITTYKNMIPHGLITDILVYSLFNLIILAANDGLIYIYNEKPRTLISKLKGHLQQVTSIALLYAKKKILISSSLDGSIRLWTLDGGQSEIYRFDIGESIHELSLIFPDPTHQTIRIQCCCTHGVYLYELSYVLQLLDHFASPVILFDRFQTSITTAKTLVAPASSNLFTNPNPKSFPSENPSNINRLSDDSSRHDLDGLVVLSLDQIVRIYRGEDRSTPSFIWIPPVEYENQLQHTYYNQFTKLLYFLYSSSIIGCTDTSKASHLLQSTFNLQPLNMSCFVVLYLMLSMNHEDQETEEQKNGVSLSFNETFYPFQDISLVQDNEVKDYHNEYSTNNLADDTKNIPKIPDFQQRRSSYLSARSSSIILNQHINSNKSSISSKNPEKNQRNHSETLFQPHMYIKKQIIHGQKSNWIVGGTANGILFFYNTQDNSDPWVRYIEAYEINDEITYIYFCSYQQLLFTCSKSHLIKIWSLHPVSFVNQIELHDIPTCLKIGYTCELICVGYENGMVELHDYHFEKPRSYRSNKNHLGMVTGADFSEKFNLCITTSLDMTIRIWDHQKQLLKLLSFSQPIPSVCFFNENGDVLCSQDGKMFVIDASELLPAFIPDPRVFRETSQLTKKKFNNFQLSTMAIARVKANTNIRRQMKQSNIAETNLVCGNIQVKEDSQEKEVEKQEKIIHLGRVETSFKIESIGNIQKWFHDKTPPTLSAPRTFPSSLPSQMKEMDQMNREKTCQQEIKKDQSSEQEITHFVQYKHPIFLQSPLNSDIMTKNEDATISTKVMMKKEEEEGQIREATLIKKQNDLRGVDVSKSKKNSAFIASPVQINHMQLTSSSPVSPHSLKPKTPRMLWGAVGAQFKRQYIVKKRTKAVV